MNTDSPSRTAAWLDLVAAADGKAKEPFRVDSDAMLSFEPIDFEWGGLPTRLAPFHWDGCHIRVTGVPKTADWSALRAWFDRWFKGGGRNQTVESSARD